MKILIVGGGGREHAICWRLAQSARRPQLFCAPGNAGTAALARNVNLAAEDIAGLLAFAKREAIDLTVIGPEDPLCAGIVDQFESAGLRIFGPCAEAAKIEGDKAFAKQLMREAGVPTAEARVFGPTAQEIAQTRQRGGGIDEVAHRFFQTGYEMARDYVVTRDEGVVVKASGLAKGKGVFVHPDPSEALRTIEDLMVKKSLGEAGARIVVEEMLTGPEVSVLALVDGQTVYLLEAASDHKRLGDRDTGPNTGGMGAFSPADCLNESDLAVIERDILVPTIDALRRDGVIYRGVLFAGLMMTTAGPKVLEFNCRFGDPETQAILMRMESDLVDVLEAVVLGRLDECQLRWSREASVCVVMASEGYPGEYTRGHVIGGLDEAARVQGVQVFHAGTARADHDVVTAGGRVLGVSAVGETVHRARERAYEAARLISFEGAQFRGDIGMRVSGR